MLASLIIVFREVLEAGLIVGIVLAATQGIPGVRPWVAGGVAAGVLGAAILAVFAGAISQALSGNGQEVFNAGILCVAVVMLGWHNIWMASHGRRIGAGDEGDGPGGQRRPEIAAGHGRRRRRGGAARGRRSGAVPLRHRRVQP